MTGLAQIRGALEQSYDAIEKLGTVMSAAQWQAQSLCPDWTARAVVGHLASVEHMLAGWLIASNYLVQGQYFQALHIPLIDGRYFDASDQQPGAPLVAIISRSPRFISKSIFDGIFVVVPSAEMMSDSDAPPGPPP